MDTPKKSPPGASTGTLGASLTVRLLEVKPTSLVFQYEVSNEATSPIYLFSLLYHTQRSGEIHVDENLVYSFLHDDGTVEMTKSLLEVPPWAVAESPEEPFLVRLDEGTKYRQTLTLSLPLRCRDPYDVNYPEGYQPEVVPAKRWLFSVGMVIDDAQHRLIKNVETGGRQAFKMAYSDGIGRQKILESEPMENTLPVFRPKRTREQQFLRQSGM